MPGIIDEYLVSLGFDVDALGLGEFGGALALAGKEVANFVWEAGKKISEFAVAAGGAIAAFAGVVIGFADKTAMADQEYRLLALHMYTSLPVARELKIALDALGQPLENIIWDPELNARFHQLVEDQNKMASGFGSDYEAQMKKIRDFRFEFTRFGVELQYFSMHIVSDVFRAFAPGLGDIFSDFRTFNDWFRDNLPQIAQLVSDTLVYAFHKVWDVLKDIWDMIKTLKDEFKGWETSSIMTSIKTWATALENIGGNIGLLLSALGKVMGGPFGKVDIKGAVSDLYRMTPDIFTPSAASPSNDVGVGSSAAAATPQNLQKWIRNAASLPDINVDPNMMLAIAAVESGGGDVNAIHQFNKDGSVLTSSDPNSHAMSVFQIQPKTQQGLGIDARDTAQAIVGGSKLFRELLNQYGNDPMLALEHWHGGSRSPNADDEKFAERVLHSYSMIVNINVTGAKSGDDTPSKIKAEFQALLDDLKKRETNKSDSQNIRTQQEFQTTWVPATQ